MQGIKMEAGCADCGYRKHPAALDFDHPENDRNGAPSLAAVAQFSWDRLKTEAERCEVVCANCHRIRTAERRAS